MKTELPQFPAILNNIRMDRLRDTTRIRKLTPVQVQPQTPPSTKHH
jgi:hypothetical protein